MTNIQTNYNQSNLDNFENEINQRKIENIYKTNFINERMAIRYLRLRTSITQYALDHCITNYSKIGLTETEIDCIKERTHTFLTTYSDFNTNQKENFPNIFKQEI